MPAEAPAHNLFEPELEPVGRGFSPGGPEFGHSEV